MNNVVFRPSQKALYYTTNRTLLGVAIRKILVRVGSGDDLRSEWMFRQRDELGPRKLGRRIAPSS